MFVFLLCLNCTSIKLKKLKSSLGRRSTGAGGGGED